MRAIPRGPRPATRAAPAGLTAREQEVLALLADGLADREISQRLFISERTVHHHVSAVLSKIGVSSRTAAAREAARLGIEPAAASGRGAAPDRWGAGPQTRQSPANLGNRGEKPGISPMNPLGLAALRSLCNLKRLEGRRPMPLFMDVHEIDGGVAMDDVAKAHLADLQAQAAHDVRYLRYWVDEDAGRVFCLVEAPSAEAANAVHREAHGLVADHIYRVQEGS